MRNWRGMTWVILGWTALIAVWAAWSVTSAANASGAVVALGLSFMFGVWLIGFLVLSIVWFMRRPAQP